MGEWPPHSLLGGLPPDEREDLLRLGSVQRFGAGETMLVEGDRDSRDVYVLLKGAVKVVGNTEDGTAVLLSIRADGDLLGELASLDGSPRLAGVVTIRTCTVRRIGQQAFLGFLRTHPGASLAVSRSVSAKLRNATWHRVEYGSAPVPVRLARLLIQLATQHGEPADEGTAIRLPLTQTELAALAGAREPTVQRALRALRQEGAIGIGYRRIVVHDWAALHEAAGISEIPPAYGIPPAPPRNVHGD
ncbi:Crp/Fnr family transcriptional regulator [Streptomyces winkii]|uniref:Crp/Fnr family transcriptional regulator n=1 Tax=Streptomyces winkii TaxID=3051178 RepID=UPI0028D4523E|nr:Crp/Fnr family transcriptional regulator [Streptomyces sp. DSM 40971]